MRKGRKRYILTLFALAACFTFAFGGCDTGNEPTSSGSESSIVTESSESGDTSSVTESTESGSTSSVTESSESGSTSSVEMPLKKVYYQSQLRFYVNPEKSTVSANDSGLNTSDSEYGVYGAYDTLMLNQMIALLQSDAFAEKVLLQGEWTAADNTDTLLNQIRDSVTYNYEVYETTQVSQAFISVWILVEGEENYGFARELYDVLCDAVPEFVEANMAIPSGYTGTNCQKISRNDKPTKTEKYYKRG